MAYASATSNALVPPLRELGRTCDGVEPELGVAELLEHALESGLVGVQFQN